MYLQANICRCNILAQVLNYHNTTGKIKVLPYYFIPVFLQADIMTLLTERVFDEF